MMKLDKIIYHALFEQRRSGKIKKVPVDEPIPIEVPDIIPDVRRNILKPNNRKSLLVAQRHGAVLDAWSSFSVILIASKPGKTELPLISSSENALRAIAQLTKEKGGTHYGAGGSLDKTGKSGVAKYMYIVGPNVSKIKRIFKYNVWVCNFEQLFTLSKKLDQNEPLQYYEQVTSNAARNKIGNIPVFMYNEAGQWFQSLQARINSVKSDTELLRKSNISLKPENANVLIPELEYLNTDYDPTESVLQTKTIEITDQNYEEYGYTTFRGIAKLDSNPYGDTILIPKKGSMEVRRYSDGMEGRFTGDFINGAPNEGSVKYDDDSIHTVKPGDARIYIDSNGKHTFTFVSRSRGVETQLSVKYTDSEEIIRFLQQDIKEMLDNNTEWVNSFAETKYYNSLRNFTIDGKWGFSMQDVVFIINAQFLGDSAIDPSTGKWYRGIMTQIPESVRKDIIKHKTEKIPI